MRKIKTYTSFSELGADRATNRANGYFFVQESDQTDAKMSLEHGSLSDVERELLAQVAEADEMDLWAWEDGEDGMLYSIAQRTAKLIPANSPKTAQDWAKDVKRSARMGGAR